MSSIQDLINEQWAIVRSHTSSEAGQNVVDQIVRGHHNNSNDPWIPAGQEDQVSVTVTPPETTRAPNILEMLFPPLGLIDIALEGGSLPTAQTMPSMTLTGTEQQVQNLIPSVITETTPPAAADPLSGLGSIVDLTVKFLPIILVVGLFTSIKKVF